MRRTTLVVAYLLLSATTAHAECAWVWWKGTGAPTEPVSAYPTKQECEQALVTLRAETQGPGSKGQPST
jgi:hypothetical protein